jgi:hypothetical protein
LTNEINSFDQYLGHPQLTGQYHYHQEPAYLTTQNGKSAFLGFLLDGFPVYGPQENGKAVSNADLDTYHGHSHATADFLKAFTIIISPTPILISMAQVFMEQQEQLVSRSCEW